jgi:predicted nuclease of restriction endonuclease-like RecB superfamily
MFSRDLLVVRKRKPYIHPVYVDPHDSDLAESVINLYQPGKEQGQIDAEIREIETHATFKQVRGFSELMRRRTLFTPEYAADPRMVRQTLLEGGMVTSMQERALRMQEAAQRLGITVEEMEHAFWADRDEFQIVQEVDVVSPAQLVQQYNLSLTQTLLFDAISLEFSTSDTLQEIFRTIKYLGLMYEIIPQEKDDDYTTRVTGPVALFRKTKKYGTALARLIPVILKASSWNIKAQIETEVAGEPRIYIFELSHGKKDYFPDMIQPPVFDSSIEEDFQNRLSALRKDWTIIREPIVLKAGPWALIPDFSIEKRNKKCLVEIVGFWTPEYLQKKIKKVEAVQEDIILLVDRKLRCAVKDMQKEPADIIFFDKKVPMKPIIDRLKKMETEQLSEDMERLSTCPLEIQGDRIDLKDIARRYEVGIEAVKETMRDRAEGMVIGSTYLKRTLVEKIRQRIRTQEDDRLSSATEVLHEFGLEEDALSPLGFSIEWTSLDPGDATIVEKPTRPGEEKE